MQPLLSLTMNYHLPKDNDRPRDSLIAAMTTIPQRLMDETDDDDDSESCSSSSHTTDRILVYPHCIPWIFDESQSQHGLPQHYTALELISDHAKSHKEYHAINTQLNNKREERPAFSPRSSPKTTRHLRQRSIPGAGRWDSAPPKNKPKILKDCRPIMPAWIPAITCDEAPVHHRRRHQVAVCTILLRLL
jgi:hypothetical protein